MASKQSLYGAPRPNAGFKRNKDITSSTSIAFTSQLSSLLAQSASSQPTTGRARPSKTGKEDIFKTHNKNTKKRALADQSTDGLTIGHKQDIGGIDPSDLHRSKRKMEEKARLYASMKRGDYVPPGGGGRSSHNLEEHSLVDFDRKWADSLETGDHQNNDTSSGEDNDNNDSDTDYEDEFGRLRRIPRSQKDLHLRRRNAATYATSQLESFAARPIAPSHIIHGDTIQSAAFNPDVTVSEQMESLARKRDRSLTPPAETHYDA
ncbi:MAG: hypothetical protein Q9200_006940, partial [Gallowayella weberi]